MTATVPGRLYVIGDIHGRADLLERMVATIAGDLDDTPPKNCLTVTLGDYIDRGPDSRKVIELLASNPFRTDFVALKGNHEAILERFLVEPALLEQWRHDGGLETLHSYGVDVARLIRGEDFDRAAIELRARLPQTHLAFLASLAVSLTRGPYFLCHAGVRPGIPLAQQRDDDLLWIRSEFLLSKADWGKIVVHGHTPVEAPEIHPNRINVDTGAYITGRLTCAVLEADQVRFLTTS